MPKNEEPNTQLPAALGTDEQQHMGQNDPPTQVEAKEQKQPRVIYRITDWAM